MSSSVPAPQALSLLKHMWQKMVKESAEAIHGIGVVIVLGYAFCWHASVQGVFFLLKTLQLSFCSPPLLPIYKHTLSLPLAGSVQIPSSFCNSRTLILFECISAPFFFFLSSAGNGQQRRRSIQDLSVAGTDSNQVKTLFSPWRS